MAAKRTTRARQKGKTIKRKTSSAQSGTRSKAKRSAALVVAAAPAAAEAAAGPAALSATNDAAAALLSASQPGPQQYSSSPPAPETPRAQRSPSVLPRPSSAHLLRNEDPHTPGPAQSSRLLASASEANASPLLSIISRQRQDINDEESGDGESGDGEADIAIEGEDSGSSRRNQNPAEKETADADNNGDDTEKLSEKEARVLWLSTVDALSHLASQDDYKYISDDRKRARVVREKYWQVVRDAAVFSQRTGVEIFLAAGRPTPGAQSLKQHVFASAGLCDPQNKVLHDAANKMAETWTSSLDAYREALIAKNKEKDDLLRYQQAQFLADQRQIQEQQQALDAALAAANALREENERLRAQMERATSPMPPGQNGSLV
ncbi:hypothetical protein V8E36_002638 [Tilletia maclaganii]